MHISEILKNNNSTKIALIYRNALISYRQLNSMVKEQCTKIKTSQDVIAIYLPNSVQYVVAYFSILSLNKTVMPLSINLKNDEIANFLKLGKISYLITNSIYYKRIIGCDEFSEIIIHNIESGEISNASKEKIVESREELSDVALLMPTSGSMGQPKIVMLTHDNILCNVKANIKSLSLTSNDVTYVSLPMCYSYCNLAQFLSHIYVGGTIVIQSSMMHIPSMIKDIITYNISNYFCNPTLLNIIINTPQFNSHNLPKLRSIYIGTAPVQEFHISKIFGALPNINCYLTYGLTEASPRVTTYLIDKNNIQISIGRSLEGIETRIVDSSGVDIQEGQVGELIIRGPNVMKGYYLNGKETGEVLRNGWLYTGDYCTFDKNNNIFIKGRKKNIINCSGVVIYPEEIEQKLIRHESIKDAYVYGEPHEIFGEVVVAEIVLYDNIDKDSFKKLIEVYCLRKLSSTKIPNIRIVESISKTITNKNKRNVKNGIYEC